MKLLYFVTHVQTIEGLSRKVDYSFLYSSRLNGKLGKEKQFRLKRFSSGSPRVNNITHMWTQEEDVVGVYDSKILSQSVGTWRIGFYLFLSNAIVLNKGSFVF